jgi:hypothetical protein
MNPIETELKQKYNNIRFELYSNEKFKRIYLTGFIVPVSLRGTGVGTDFMNDLTRLADKYGYKITLTPSSSYGGNVNRLKQFYQRFGFVFNKGSNRDYSHMEDMYREPKTVKLKQNEIILPEVNKINSIINPDHNIIITDRMAKEAQKYSSDEEFIRNGGFSIQTLDMAAFGFSDETTSIPINLINIKWKEDLNNVKYEIKQSNLTPINWAKTISLEQPIEISYSKGKVWLEDGHHRFMAAKLLNIKELPCDMTLKAKPLDVLAPNMSYDDFTRMAWKKAINL